uniref:Uncharacterized protein n=1 Tax=Opuntia streptacantha TaxID=393608 RepID=A0A7C9AM12_OPUST
MPGKVAQQSISLGIGNLSCYSLRVIVANPCGSRVAIVGAVGGIKHHCGSLLNDKLSDLTIIWYPSVWRTHRGIVASRGCQEPMLVGIHQLPGIAVEGKAEHQLLGGHVCVDPGGDTTASAGSPRRITQGGVGPGQRAGSVGVVEVIRHHVYPVQAP